MRSEMASNLETFSFGYSWDNKTVFDSLYYTLARNNDLITKKFLWKNRPSNSVERDYFRLLVNYGLSVVDGQEELDPLMKLLLEYDPYLIPEETDNIPDLANQIKSFYPLPALKVGIKAGINFNIVGTPVENYEVVQSPVTRKEYSPDIGWQLAFPISYMVARGQSISIEPGLSYSNFDIKQTIPGSTQSYKYRIYYLDLPLVYSISLLNPSLKGFSEIGNYNAKLVRTLDNSIGKLESKIEETPKAKSGKLERRVEKKLTRRDYLALNTPYKRVVPKFILGVKPKARLSSFVDADDSDALTNRFQLDAVAGLGIDFYQKKNIYSIQARYNYGILNTNAAERYYFGGEVAGLLFDEFVVSDDFRTQIIELSLTIDFILNNKVYKIR